MDNLDLYTKVKSVEHNPPLRTFKGTFKWTAEVEGPWYADSNPYGEGDSEEEAIKNALEDAKYTRDLINRLLEKHGMN